MKTVAQWAEQLPELIRIEFLKECKQDNIDLLKKTISLEEAINNSLEWEFTYIGYDFYHGVWDNSLTDPISADYLDESVPYTKEEVNGMIIQYADQNDEVCRVMLDNVCKSMVVAPSAKAKLIVLDELGQTETRVLDAPKWGELVEAPKEKKSLKNSSIIKTLKAENEALKADIFHLEETIRLQKETIKTLTQMKVAPKKEQSIFFDLLEHLKIIKK